MNAKSTKDGKDTRVLDKLIGNWIHYRRKQAGYSQLELAKAVGLSQQHLAHVEAGNRSMSLYGLLNMRNVLNFTIGELEHYIDNLGVEITMVTLDDLIDIQHWSIHLSEKELTSAIQEQRVYALKTPWELVGICCFDVFRKEPTLRYLFVDPNYRKQGYGKKLILSWENVMREQGFTSILTIISENDNIKYFFEKLGYQYVGFIQSRARKSEDVMYRQYLSSE